MDFQFEYDDDKAAANLKKHHIDFDDARLAFFDQYRSEHVDDRESYGEDRWITIGFAGPILLVVTYTMRGDTIRLISARRAQRHEEAIYAKHRKEHD